MLAFLISGLFIWASDVAVTVEERCCLALGDLDELVRFPALGRISVLRMRAFSSLGAVGLFSCGCMGVQEPLITPYYKYNCELTPARCLFLL